MDRSVEHRVVAERQEGFGERLRRLREAAGYSQEHLAERAGISANAVGALERGERRRPYPGTIRRLADALGLDDEARLALTAAARDGSAAAPASDLPPAAGELPGEPTPLIGREQETDELRRLLADPGTRVLTLVGPGGVGKTRLALHLAHSVSRDYRDGVVWVELAPLADPALVPAAIAAAIGLEEVGVGAPAVALRSWLRDLQMLLVLDNLEHLPDASPDLAQLLLGCPQLRVLATSRSPLQIRGEQEYHVRPLQVPPDDLAESEHDLAAFAAVRLFVQQAQRADPDFALTAEDASAVASICRRLDGLPLALELVAARVRVLSPPEMLTRVDHLLPLLVGGARDLPERQRTMRAAIAWSEDLLDPAERTLFRRLAVFSGGCDLEAAEAVGAEGESDAATILDRLDALAAQSLVTVGHGRQGTRYGMLEPVRQFAMEQLSGAGEEDATRRRHARYFRALAERGAAEIEGRSGQAAWVERLEREQDNLRAALTWCLHADDGTETGLRLATALWRFWEMRWRVVEGDQWLAALLARSTPLDAAVRASALNAAGNLARDLGDYRRARALHEGCLALRRELGAPRGIASSLNNLGVIARDRGDAEATVRLCQESFDLFSAAGDRHGAAIALISLGAAAGQQGDLERACARYEESLAMFRAEGDPWHTAWVLIYLAEVKVRAGDLASARSMAEEGLETHRAAGEAWGMATALGVLGRADQADGALADAARRFMEALDVVAEARVERAVPSCLDDLAGLLLAGGHPDRAARLAGAGEAWRKAGGLTRAPVQDEQRAAALRALHHGPHASEWSEGVSLTRDRVFREADAVRGLFAVR